MGTSEKNFAILLVAVGAILFGTLGLVTRFLQDDVGIPAFDVANIRLVVATLTLIPLLLIFDRRAFRIHRKDLPLFVLFGLFKFLSDGTLFFAMDHMNISMAILLQMTAPYYVMLLSLFMFRERITAQKLLAMFLTFMGCTMVTGVLYGEIEMNVAGGFSAIISGFFYAMFIIGGRVGSRKGYSPQTTLFYTFLFGTICATIYCITMSDFTDSFSKLGDVTTLTYALVLGIGLTLIPFYFYTYGTAKIEASMVAMISVLEVVVAAIVGYFVLGEGLSISKIIGMTLVVASIAVVDVKISHRVRARQAEMREQKKEE